MTLEIAWIETPYSSLYFEGKVRSVLGYTAKPNSHNSQKKMVNVSISAYSRGLMPKSGV